MASFDLLPVEQKALCEGKEGKILIVAIQEKWWKLGKMMNCELSRELRSRAGNYSKLL
jgi:hypothetical protein